MIGLSALCTVEVTPISGAIKYSGLNWNAKLDNTQTENISPGSLCKITTVGGNTMIVKSV